MTLIQGFKITNNYKRYIPYLRNLIRPSGGILLPAYNDLGGGLELYPTTTAPGTKDEVSNGSPCTLRDLKQTIGGSGDNKWASIHRYQPPLLPEATLLRLEWMMMNPKKYRRGRFGILDKNPV
jgi:hypothetical protein